VVNYSFEIIEEQKRMATPAGFEPATFSLEGNGATSYFNAILTKGHFLPSLNTND
jgi:hypothetical protein